LSHRAIRFSARGWKKYEFAVFEVAGNAHIRERFQSTAGMRYDCVARQPNLPDVREEAM